MTRLVIAEAENPAGLALARALAATGHEVVATFSDATAPVRVSRVVRSAVRVPAAGAQPSAFVAAVAQLSARTCARAVLPGTESALLALSEAPDSLPPAVLSGTPPAAVVVRATDKLELAALAQRAGFGTPPTTIVETGELPEAVTYPAVVKPVRSEVELPGGGRARSLVARVASPDEAEAALRAIPAGHALIQPFLSGPVVTVNGAAWRGETLATVHQRAERLWPADCGVLAAARTVAPDPWLDAACRRLIADLGWSGLFNLQFIVHDGAPLLFDLNPRAYHTLALAVAAGVNLPALWVERLLGAPATAPREARPGVRFRAEIDDGRAVLRLASRGDLRAALRAARPHRGTVHALAAPGDRRPALVTIATFPLKRIRVRLTTG